MPSLTGVGRGLERLPHPLVRGDGPRDRLADFRWMYLVFALCTLAGGAVTLDVITQSTPHRLLAAACAILLAGWWGLGHRRRSFPTAVLPLEAMLLVGFTMSLGDPVWSFPLYFIGVQYRALYGTRRDTWLLTFAYGFAFVIGVGLSAKGLVAITPVVLIEILALGFGSYLLHSLAEVLERDLDRANELRKSEDRYRTLFERNPWPMWVADPISFRFLDANQAAVREYGYTKDEFLAMTAADLRTEEDLPALEGIRVNLAGVDRTTYLTRHRKRDGSLVDVELTVDFVDFGGRRARIALAVDVTHRERAEKALRESEQRFRSVAENLREALMISDADDRIILANSRVRDVLGYEPDEVIGKSASALLLPSSQQRVFTDKLRRRLRGEAELYEVELVRKDGSRIFAEVSAAPYRDAAGTIVGTLGAISDISDRKRLEDSLRHAVRMEAVGQLAGGVAHDFNNLLTVIKCHTELMLAELPSDNPSRGDVVAIEQAAIRAATLTKQLLAFGRKQLLQPKRIVLADALGKMTSLLRSIVGPGVDLVVGTDMRGEVDTDPLQLEYVLLTMARNAAEAMHNGGTLSIDARAYERTGAEAMPARQEMPSGRYAVISVQDTGVGMEPATLERVFEPFFTTKGPGEGIGLGLASAYGIVRQGGGFLHVESTPNVGTTFRIFLPMASSLAPETEEPPELRQSA